MPCPEPGSRDSCCRFLQGLTGPQFNGYTFQIWEGGADWVIANKYPGNFGASLCHQSGVLQGPNDIPQNGTDGKLKLIFAAAPRQPASLSTFFQPALSYIPTPGAGADLDEAWALTFRLMVLF